MNIYNTVNWLFGSSVQTVEMKFQGRNYLSNLPADILKVIMNDLPDNSVRALHLTERKIMPAAEAILSLRTQNLLTILNKKLIQEVFESTNFDKDRDEIRANSLKLAKKVERFPNGSTEGLEALRNTMCYLYRISRRSYIFPFDLADVNSKFSKDKLLLVKLLTNVDYGHCQRANISCSSEGRTKVTNLYFNLVETNQACPQNLHIHFSKKQLDETSLKPILGALCKSNSISKLVLNGKDWNLLNVKAILDVVMTNASILDFGIRDLGASRNAVERDWSWVKNAKDKSKMEFEELIENEVKNSFEFIERDCFGFLIYKRIG